MKEVTLKTMNRKISKISLTSLTHYLFLLIQNSQELIKIRSYFCSLLFDMSHRSATYQKKGEWMGVLILIRLSQEQKQIYIELYWKFRHRFRSNRIPRTVFQLYHPGSSMHVTMQNPHNLFIFNHVLRSYKLEGAFQGRIM